jgi:hypothetical protein
MRRGTPLRHQSRKRSALARKRRQHVTEYLAAHPRCVRCEMPADDVHEPLTRARGGSILDDANSLPVCRSCHSWIHGNVAEATVLGWLVPSSA